MAVSLRHALAQALAVCGMVAVWPAFVVSVPSASSRTPTTCAELRVWAEAYRDATPTLDEFARFDRAQRRAMFGAVAPSVRAALWREQMRRLGRQSRWSPAQRGLFRDASAQITPELYEQEPVALGALVVLKSQVDAAFAIPGERRVWLDLGDMVAATTAARAPYCDCNLSSQDCWGGALCASVACTPFSPGCGFLGASVCNGRCER